MKNHADLVIENPENSHL